jgi:site-specific recombinase XerD
VYKYKTKAGILTKDEINTLISACKKPVERAMISVLYDSAARIDEFIKLKIGDVVKEGEEYIICVTGKTGQRNIPLNYSMKYMLEYLEEHPYRNLRTAPLWLNRKNQQYSENGIYTIMKSIVKRSAIQKHVHNHLFRHSRLTELAHEGMNESQMRVFAGWKNDSTMPAIYLHLSNDDVKDALRRIEPKATYVEKESIEQQVSQRLEQERQKMHDEILAQLLETLKDPQHRAIQDYLFSQSERP